jgi:subtilisin family serine protease
VLDWRVRFARCLLAAGVTLAVLSGAVRARAQVNVRALIEATTRAGLPPAFRIGGSSRLAALIEVPAGVDARAAGLEPVAPGLATLDAAPSELLALGRAHPAWTITWSPPRHPLLDQAAKWIEAPAFRNDTGDTGKGAIVGIVDTGVDPSHPDLRTADGRTRIAWFLDLSREPAGLHPDLESEYGCTGKQGYTCAVYDAADLDQMIAANIAGELPIDSEGHGTDVASLAAGNGLSNTPPRYVGIAPDATIVAVRATRSNADTILDSDILLGTRFVFDRAEAMKLPAVVNLSLGSDFGPHDGTSALERGLAAFVGPNEPGRAIVVAAGNSAAVYLPDAQSPYPGPWGTHTEVHVPYDSSVRVPVLTPPSSSDSTDSGTIYIWVGERAGDALDVGIDDEDGGWVDPLSPGDAASFNKSGLEATVFNATTQSGSPLSEPTDAVVVLDGKWPAGETFAVRLEGHGTADLWVQSEGAFAPDGVGALFPRATKEGTINVPASSPALIAVGATLNRTSWVDRAGHLVQVDELGSVKDPVPDSSAYFSAAGPNALGDIKPDVVAPGVFVIGAMSALADPTKNGGTGLFAASDQCESGTQCLVVDNYHAVASGTSMSAPLVSGALALWLAQDPTLTQDSLLTWLQAGARRLGGAVPLATQVGAGELDLEGMLDAKRAETNTSVREPAKRASWLVLSSSIAHPDPSWVIEGELELRDQGGRLADGFARSRLALETDPASVVEPLTRVAPGLWRFSVAAPAGTGGGSLTLRVSYAGALLAERTLPIAVDPWVAADGVAARGGCALAPSEPRRESPFELALCAAAFGWVLRRHRKR